MNEKTKKKTHDALVRSPNSITKFAFLDGSFLSANRNYKIKRNYSIRVATIEIYNEFLVFLSRSRCVCCLAACLFSWFMYIYVCVCVSVCMFLLLCLFLLHCRCCCCYSFFDERLLNGVAPSTSVHVLRQTEPNRTEHTHNTPRNRENYEKPIG